MWNRWIDSRRVAPAVMAVAMLATVLALAFGEQRALAVPPTPDAILDVPTEGFIGEDVTFTVAFDNADVDAPGYGPYLDLWLPATGADGAGAATDDGLSFAGATYLGATVNSQVITLPACPPPAGLRHPFTNQPLTCPAGFGAGDQLVVLEMPFGSFTPGQPPAEVEVTATGSNLADLETPLTIRAGAGFRYGATATGSTPIVEAVGAYDSADYEPTLLTFEKEYLGPEDETATGPSFPRQYVVRVGVAQGQVLESIEVTDHLANDVVYLGAGTPTPGDGTLTVEPPDQLVPHNAPDNELTATFDEVTGAGEWTIEMPFAFYAPELDADGEHVLDPSTGDDVISENEASATATWVPIDTRDAEQQVTVDPEGPEHELELQSIAVQKGVQVVDDVGADGPSPGDTLEYTVDLQVSDYFTFDDVALADVYSDGQTLDPAFAPTFSFGDRDDSLSGVDLTGRFTHVVDSACALPGEDVGSAALDFDLSGALQDEGGDGVMTGAEVDFGSGTGPAATGTVTFRTIIDSDYRCLDGGEAIDVRDDIGNRIVISGEVLDDATQASQQTPRFEDDDSGAGVAIVDGGITKNIYARNEVLPADVDDPDGGPPPGTQYAAGDSITYRLTAEVPLTNVEQLQIQDFLPLPVLRAAGFSTTFDGSANPTGALPAVGSARLGSLDTFTAATGIVPTVAVDTVANSLTFDYGDHQGADGETPATIDILLRVEISSDPFVDGLFLTNQTRMINDNSFTEPQNDDQIVQFELTNPVLELTKGVVSSDNADDVYSPTTVGPVAFTAPGSGSPRWSGTISSGGLATSPVNSNITGGVDAGDLVTHAIVVENTGAGLYGAFDVRVSDVIPAGYEIPAGGLNLQVTNGAGTALPYTDLGGGLFGTGIELDDGPNQGALGPFDPTSGENVLVVTYDLQLDDTTDGNPVAAGQTLTNTATVDGYSGSETGDPYAELTDTASVRVQQPLFDKNTTGTDQAFTTGSTVAIGEEVTYTVDVTIPEGSTDDFTITDDLDPSLAFVSFDDISVSPDDGSLSSSLDPDLDAALQTALDDVTVTPATGEGAGNVARFDFGDLTNTDLDDATDHEISITYTVSVLNVASNQRNTGRNNAVTSSVGGSDSAPNVTIAEPNPQVDKTVSPTEGDAGDQVSYTLVVTNPCTTPPAATTCTTAFDVQLTDLIPEGTTYVPGSLVHVGGEVPSEIDDSGDPLVVRWDELEVGEEGGVDFSVILDDDISVGELDGVLTNEAEVQATSLPEDGDPSESPYTDLDVERTGDTDDAGGAANDLRDADDADVDLVAVDIEKELVETSEPDTLDPSVAIGEVVTYDLVVTLPEGVLPGFTVTDHLPAGMGYVGHELIVDAGDTSYLSDDFDGTLGAATPTPAAPPGADGQDLQLAFGPTTVTAGDSSDDRFVVRVDAQVLDVPGNRGDDQTTGPDESTVLANTASVQVQDDEATSDAVETPVVEPILTIAKEFSQDTAAANDVVTVGLTVDNLGNGTAHDVVIEDVIDGDLFPAAGISEVITPPGWTFSTVDLGNGDTLVRFTGGHVPVNPVLPLQFGFDLTLADPVPVPGSATNTATVTQATTLDGDVDGERDEPDVSDDDTLIFSAPDLRVEKDDGTQVRTPGETFDYTLTVTNDGARDATGVQLTDALPDGLTFDSASDGGVHAAGTVSWPTFDLAAGASTSRTVTVTVDDPLADDLTDFLNLASVVDDGTHGADPNPDDNSDTDLDTTDAVVDVSVTKDDGQQTRTPGETYTYTLTVENGGNQDESGILVTDELPDGLSFVSASDGGSHAAGVVSWPAFALAGGGSTTRTVTVTVDAPAAAGVDAFVNEAAVTSPNDANPQNNSDQDTDVLDATPDLTITKTDGVTTTSDGEQLTYTLTIGNVGDQDATGVLVRDQVPEGTSYVSSSAGGTVALGVVSWPLFSLGAGAEVTRTITVEVDDPLAPGISSILNSAGAIDDGTNGPDPDQSDNTDIDFDLVAPDLVLTKDDGTQTRSPGEEYTYTLDVENVGGDATGVVVTDVLPATLEFVSAGNGGTYNGDTRTVTWPAFDMASGTEVSRSVTVRLVDPVPFGTTEIVNEAAVTDDGSNGADPTPEDNEDSDTDEVDSTLDLAITKTDGETEVGPGDSLTYTLTVTNEGDEDSEDAVVTDTLPNGLIFVSASNGGTHAGGTSTGGGTVTWPAFDLVGGGATTERTVSVTVADPVPAGVDSVTNAASVDAPGDEDDSNDEATDEDVVDATPDLTVTKTDGQETALVGETLTYVLTVGNVGDQDATGVLVTDLLPEGTSFVSASDGGTAAAGEVTWPTFSLASGASTTRTVTVTVDDPLPAETVELVNSTTVDDDRANGEDPTPEDNTDTDTDQTGADLSVAKTNGQTETTPGEAVSYTITVSNAGPETVDEVVLTETLPTSLEDVEYETSEGTFDPTTGSWTGLTLAPGEQVLLVVRGTVAEDALGTITNAVTVDHPQHADPDPSDNSDEDEDELTPQAELSIVKQADVASVRPGGEVTYTLAIANAGPSTATDVVVVDELPAGLRYVSHDGTGWDADVDGQTLTFTRQADLPVDGTDAIEITARVVATSGDVVNVATVDSSVSEVDGTDNEDAAALDLIVDPDDPIVDELEDRGGYDRDDGSLFDRLARTGSNPVVLLLFGLGALGVGAALLGVGRRHRRTGEA
jgi:uncharacterized repeat protein (TIGR01451 family)/fimbrial isopeptide formation D2 family protein